MRPKAPKRKLRKNSFKQAEIVALAMTGRSNRDIAKIAGVHRHTVARILSQEECAELVQRYRSAIMDRLPQILKGLDHLIKKKDRQTILDCLFGMNILAQHHELKIVPPKRERTYASAMVEYHYLYGKWPTLQEAKDFDKKIKVELLTKESAEKPS